MRRAPSLPNETSGTVWVELCTVHPWPMGALNYALSRPGRCIQTPKYSYPRCTRGDCSYRPVFIFLSSLSFSLSSIFFPLSSTPLYFPPPDSKLFELASRDPNRPPSLPLPVRVNARFSYAQNEKTTARLNNDCRLQNRASSLIIFLPACVNCGLRNVQSRGNKYARGVERMLD